MSRRKIGTKKKHDLPASVYIIREVDGDDSYLALHETMEAIEDEVCVGVYELQEVRTMHVTRELVSE